MKIAFSSLYGLLAQISTNLFIILTFNVLTGSADKIIPGTIFWTLIIFNVYVKSLFLMSAFILMTFSRIKSVIGATAVGFSFPLIYGVFVLIIFGSRDPAISIKSNIFLIVVAMACVSTAIGMAICQVSRQVNRTSQPKHGEDQRASWDRH